MKTLHTNNRHSKIILVVTIITLAATQLYARIITTKDAPVSGRWISEMESDLRKKTGLASLRFDENAELVYDNTEAPNGGSEAMREVILEATNDMMRVFSIVDASESEDVHFALTDQGTVDITSRVTTYLIRYDYDDFENSRKYTSAEVQESYSLGITLFHEIDHKVSYDKNHPIPPGGIRPDKCGKGVRGVIANTNKVRKELSLVLRRADEHMGRLYRGLSQKYRKTYEIRFETIKGKGVLHLRWKPESVR